MQSYKKIVMITNLLQSGETSDNQGKATAPYTCPSPEDLCDAETRKFWRAGRMSDVTCVDDNTCENMWKCCSTGERCETQKICVNTQVSYSD